ncbi:CHAT domain-containing protein [Methylolobus aquaticus]|nr:CHAT domain-containing protein [Methylolobus aquaticus]
MTRSSAPLKLRFPLSAPPVDDGANLPTVLTRPANRGEGGDLLQLLPNVTAVRSWPLAPASRSADAPEQAEAAADSRLLALEASDGTTVFMRADALAERLARLHPEAVGVDGAVDLARLRERSTATRGTGDWLWRQVTELAIEPDAILDAARDKAEEWLGEKIGTKPTDWAIAGASWAGAKALMWAVESRLAAEPGLYRWRNGEALSAADRMDRDKLRVLAGGGTPALVFIHGTGSHTLGSFGELPASAAWMGLLEHFGEHIYGFEHRTFSESPIENALQLLSELPDGARISVVTHSRGGLVGDLLCVNPDDTKTPFDALIEQYRRRPRQDEIAAEDADPRLKSWREAAAEQERDKLRQLLTALRQRRLVIDRYVRVACPARGTALLSDNLDLFLSGLLTLVRKFGAWSSGAVAGLVATPAAGVAARAAADRWLQCLARVVLEIAEKRLQPQVVPGIEAMLPEAPMGMFLGLAPCRTLPMAIVAGDIDGGGWIKRIGLAFTDWMFFDRLENDLVVDSASMYAGIAPRAEAQAIFVQGAEVNHFRYFRDATATGRRPLPEAMVRWLVEERPEELTEWQPLSSVLPGTAKPVSRGGPVPLPPKNSRPVVVYLPGIMGSSLYVARGGKKDHVWVDPDDLVFGGLEKIAAGKPAIPEGVVEMAYGKLEEHLAARGYYVETCAYDWRKPVTELGREFAVRLATVLSDHKAQPIRILAHSMGGLVVRAALASRQPRADFFGRAGNRLIMMGTPNHGSHLMVQTLFGLSGTIRTLARFDLKHDMDEVLAIVSGYGGAINLLPAPGFVDAGSYAGKRFYDRAEWERLKEVNDDFWFGRNLCGVPSAEALAETARFWDSLADTDWVRHYGERIAYVFGQADATPCGLSALWTPDGRMRELLIAETPFGDGSVTWASGRLRGLPDENYWLMEADHMGLTSTPRFFGEIEALLEGRMPRLKRLPVSRGAGESVDGAVTTRRPGPPPGWPTATEVQMRLLGSRPATLKPRRAERVLEVMVRGIDLRFVQIPVMCGHYRGDPIAGAEGVIDRHLVAGALSERHRLGIRTGELGTTTVVLMPRTAAQRLRRTGRGAIVVGLGEMGRLSADNVTEAVRSGVLSYLLHASNRYSEECVQQDGVVADGGPLPLRLASVLIGTNSASQLEVGEAVRAIVLGVLHANRDFALNAPGGRNARAYVAGLELVELYLDTAIAAARAVSELEATLGRELERLGARLEVAAELSRGEGSRHRLDVMPFTDYWPRLTVTDADRDELGCGPECYMPRWRNPIPPDAMRRLLGLYGIGDRGGQPELSGLPFGLDQAPTVSFAERLRYAYLGERARAEVIVQQRQPGLIEKLVRDALTGPASTVYVARSGFGATLFPMLVPLELKASLRRAPNLILMVDEATANLPWEMLEVDGTPWVTETQVVRQFLTARFRREVIRAEKLTALVISNPSTEGYHAQFGGPGWKPEIGVDGQPLPDRLPELNGAVREGEIIAGALEAAGYAVEAAPPDSRAAEVFAKLLAQPYRVLVVDAHGVFGKRAADGTYRSGVVLSDGLLLSAAEIGLMATVPDLVFLNCCHLARAGVGEGGNRLAAGLARELIEMGVRGVVAAGWEVRDDAARTFAETFFQQMVGRGVSFGRALSEARRTTFQLHADCNTWGAYQAYGDPEFRLATVSTEATDMDRLVSPEQLLDWLAQRRIEAGAGEGKGTDFRSIKRRVTNRLRKVPEPWKARADVLEACARLYAEYLPEGSEAARLAFQAALAEDSWQAPASISAIEQLINLEAREGEWRSLPGSNQDLDEAQRLARSAVKRITALEDLTSGAAVPLNVERQSIFGSAYKQAAAVALRAGQGWEAVEASLKKARDAYARGEGDPSMPGWNPYACLNRLQLDAVLGAPADDACRVALARCKRAARSRFAATYDLFDGVMAADTAVTEWLFHRKPPRSERAHDEDADRLLAVYRGALKDLSASGRQLDSVVTQLQLVAEFLEARGEKADKGDRARSVVLRRVVSQLGGVADPGRGASAEAVPVPDHTGEAANDAPPDGEEPGR